MDTSTEHGNMALLPDGFNGEMVGPETLDHFLTRKARRRGHETGA